MVAHGISLKYSIVLGILMEIALLPASLGHSQTTDKLSSHPPAEYEYIAKVIEFLMHAELETLFLGPKDKEGQPHHPVFHTPP